MIADDLKKWLNPHGHYPLAVHPRFQVVCARLHILVVCPPDYGLKAQDQIDVEKSDDQATLRDIALRIVLNHAVIIAEYYAATWNPYMNPCHAVWRGSGGCEYPAPDLDSFLQEGPSQRAHVESLLSLLRYPGPYDASMEYNFERTIRPAIKLLFEPYQNSSYVSPS